MIDSVSIKNYHPQNKLLNKHITLCHIIQHNEYVSFEVIFQITFIKINVDLFLDNQDLLI